MTSLFFDFFFIKLHRWFGLASLMEECWIFPLTAALICHFFKKLKFSKNLNFCVEFWFLFRLSLRWTLHRQLQCLKIITLNVMGCAVDHGEALHFSWDKICVCICFFHAEWYLWHWHFQCRWALCLIRIIAKYKKMCANKINTDQDDNVIDLFRNWKYERKLSKHNQIPLLNHVHFRPLFYLSLKSFRPLFYHCFAIF